MDEDLRPLYSPYMLITVPLQFADGRTLNIPPHLLSQSPKLEAMYQETRLKFPDVSDDVGHVIIHYLYTGTYQSLRPEYSELQKAIATEFSTSIRTYNAAETYELPNLAELAKAEIERLGEKLQVALVFDILREICPNPGAGDVWLSNFLKNRLKSFLRGGAMKPLQSKTGIPHKTVPISHILFKGMLELYREQEESRLEKIHDTFEVAAGDCSGFPLPLASSYSFAKPVVKSNMDIGELEGNISNPDNMWIPHWFNMKQGRQVNTTPKVLEKNGSEDISTQDVGTCQYKKTEKGCGNMGPLNEKESKEQASPKTQQQANQEIEHAIETVEEKINQEAAIAEEEAEIAQLVEARRHTIWGMDRSAELRLDILQARARERAKGQAFRKAEESVKGKGIKSRISKKAKRNHDSNVVEVDPLSGPPENHLMTTQQTKGNNDKEDIVDTWVSLCKNASEGRQKMDRDSESNTPQKTKLDED
ncbi:hypothetical protein THAR02_02781 [Trichoderma harzianum]|uniref:BTB domain-containing protein n=1 Tax=Trichoderma harzianum TaxID=5544 RepID=A0A0F9ZYR5_TRIHA|nr:hypothetical protein THAR02_02781 [Trichoderma harzianum]